MTYLLDTNAWVEYLRQRNATVVQRVSAANPADIVLCSIVVAELLYGVQHSAPSLQSKNLALVQQLRLHFQSLPFDDRAAEEYGIVRADLSARGLMIGANDLLIASIALVNQVTVVTHNTAQFNRINGLMLEDWQMP